MPSPARAHLLGVPLPIVTSQPSPCRIASPPAWCLWETFPTVRTSAKPGGRIGSVLTRARFAGLTEEQITEIFSGAGRVINFRLVYDRETGRPKGFGFAEFPDNGQLSTSLSPPTFPPHDATR